MPLRQMIYHRPVYGSMELHAGAITFDPADNSGQTLYSIGADQNARTDAEEQPVRPDTAAFFGDIENRPLVTHAALRAAMSRQYDRLADITTRLRNTRHGVVYHIAWLTFV